jgi:hypothetical protein
MAMANLPNCRAKMKDGLVQRFRDFFGAAQFDGDAEWMAFVESIEGKEVTLTFTHGDAFEAKDDNYWLPSCMWDRIEDEGTTP